MLLFRRARDFKCCLYSCRLLYQIPENSLLKKHFNYVSQPPETREPGTPCLGQAQFSKDINSLLEKLDRTFADPEIQNIVGNKTYNDALSNFPIILDRFSANKDQLVKMLFYVGLLKKSNQAQALTNNLLNKLQKSLHTLTLEDTCILANTVFKCSVPKINPIVIKLIVDMINKNFSLLIKNNRELICLIKTLRQQQHHDYKLLQDLADNSAEWLTESSTEVVHIVSYFAEAKFSPPSSKDMILHCLKNLASESKFRDKDIARILWVSSVLGTDITDIEADEVWKLMEKKEADFQRHPEFLLDCLLSMAVMGHFSSDLTQLILKPKVFEHFKKKNKKVPWIRLQKLLKIYEIEHGTILTYEGPTISEPTVDYQIQQRPAMRKIVFALKCLTPKLQLTSMKCSLNVPTVYDAGIEVARGEKSLSIEVLDSTVCLYKSNLPAGHMKLKLRLLEKLQRRTLIVNQEDLALSEDKLISMLDEKIDCMLS